MDIDQKIEYFKIAKECMSSGKNIVATLMQNGASKSDSIELAYELQAGEYTRNFSEHNLARNKKIHSIINKYIDLPDVNNIGVFGVGEAKNWIAYEGKIKNLYGVELSFSRLIFAKQNIEKVSGIESFQLLKGDASENIFADNSFDIAITQHSIEPNGNEQGSIILNNVINSAAKYVILFEPDFSTAHESMKSRMLKHDYVRNISDELEKNNSINIIEKYVMDIHENKDNLTTCWIIEKKEKTEPVEHKMICPFSKDVLTDYPEFMYSKETGLAFPKINNFILLNKHDAIFLGKLD